MSFSPPSLATERLVLRPHHRGDFDACAAMWGSPAVARFIGGSPSTRQETWFRMLRYAGLWPLLGYGYWAITDAATGEFLGDVGFADFQRGVPMLDGYPEVGWALAPGAWGRGIATEAVQAIVTWGDTNLEAEEVRCIIDAPNTASVRVAEKAGFRALGQAALGGSTSGVFSRPRGGVLENSS
jgi:RimJ/RimL family protein N-acetyltransferase